MKREMDQIHEPSPAPILYCLAGRCVEIAPIHDYVHAYCADYRCPGEERCAYCREERCDEKGVNYAGEGICGKKACGKPDISVRVSQADIDYERIKSIREDEAEGIPVRRFSDEYLETLAVYRRIAEEMPYFDTFLIHGSAVAVDGSGYLFTAKSGTGKSTHARLWRELMGSRAVMINDDKPLLRIVSSDLAHAGGGAPDPAEHAGAGDSTAVICGTPWCGKHGLNTNTAVPLKAICVLERGEENRIREISKAEAALFLLKQIYRPANPEALMRTLTLIDKLNVRFYRLACNMELQAAELSYGVMSK